MAESAVSTVLESVGSLVVQETKFLYGVKDEVKSLKDELNRLQGYLRYTERIPRSVDGVVHILLRQIRDASYEAENVIELADYMDVTSRYAYNYLSTLYKVGVDIEHVKRKLNDIFLSAGRLKINLDSGRGVDEPPEEDYGLMHQKKFHVDDVVMVGFQYEYKKIVSKLVHKEKKLTFVSIVAMGGIGKTTLARKVYTSSSEVKRCFDIVAWVNVSQKFKVIDLLKVLLKQIPSGRNETRINEMNEHEVRKKVRDILLPKRYLVVLDDVWKADTETINAIFEVFPDATNSSRLLITTRNEDVVNYAKMQKDVYTLKLLDKRKSWEALSGKVSAASGIHDLANFKAPGRKLAEKCDGLPLTLAVLGGHLSKNLNTQAWFDMLLGWPSTKGIHMVRDIIDLSYKGLPNYYLRSCLLYLAAFPEDFIIHVPDLIKLWMAESFIPHKSNCTPEETARKYLAELAQRSLVQVVQTNNDYGWPIEEIRVHDIVRDWCIEKATRDHFLDIIDETTRQVGVLPHNNLVSYRSSFRNLNGGILWVEPSLRTLLGFGFSSGYLPKLRFLRVLQVHKLNLKDFSKVIGKCIHLRYLRLSECEYVTLPSSIGQLPYLQTIDLTGTQLKSTVPISLWDIPTLRYAYIHNVISLPRSSVQIPQNLRELHICGTKTEEDPMPILEKLPCLVALGLYRYKTKTMSCSAREYPRLQKLQLHPLDIKHWRMAEGAMPELSHLEFSCGASMDRIPEDLLHLLSLKFVYLANLKLYYLQDSTVVGLKQKGCEIQKAEGLTGYQTKGVNTESLKQTCSISSGNITGLSVQHDHGYRRQVKLDGGTDHAKEVVRNT